MFFFFFQLDVLLAQLLSVCSVDLMPGENDPANLVLPQQVTIYVCVVVACIEYHIHILFGCSRFVATMIMCTVG